MKSPTMKPSEIALSLVFFIMLCGGLYLIAVVAAG